jgi:hypothetical protein
MTIPTRFSSPAQGNKQPGQDQTPNKQQEQQRKQQDDKHRQPQAGDARSSTSPQQPNRN